METRYSNLTGTSYPFDIEYGDGLPPDVIVMDQSDYQTLIEARAAGKSADYRDGAILITPPPSLTLDQIKAAKQSELAADFAQRMSAVKAGYPNDEIQSWFDQKSEAVAYTAEATAATPLLSAMSSARGITVADLAARVITNAVGYAASAGLFIGKRQRYEDAVNAATDAEAVALVIWTD